MKVYQYLSLLSLALAYQALVNSLDVAGYFDPNQKNVVIDFSKFLLVLGASLITYYLQYLLYTVVIAKSSTTRFICAAVWSLIKADVYPKLYVMSYGILLAYAFQETSMILQYVFYASYRMELADERERFLVVKVVIIHSFTFAVKDFIVANYVPGAVMSIPVTVGLLALLDYNQTFSTLREWFNGHCNDMMNAFVENVVEDRNGPAGVDDGNGHVVSIEQ